MPFFKCCCPYVDESSYKKNSSHAQLGGAFTPEIHHHENKTVIFNVYTGSSESVQSKLEQLSLDATSKLFTMYSLFG